MPALSKKQQKFMGIVRSIQKGEQPASKFSKDAQDVAKDMKKKDVKKFASTKHKGLPMKKEILGKLKEMIRQELSEYTYGSGDIVKDVNPSCPHYGAQGKVKSVGPKSVVFVVMNKGKNFKPGMELEKSHDQMKKMNENKVVKVGDRKYKLTPLNSIPKVEKLAYDGLVSYRGLGVFGAKVFEFTLGTIPNLINELDEVVNKKHDYYLLHQANEFMLKHIRRKAKLEKILLPINIQNYGNTSPASIPLLICTELKNIIQESKLNLALHGFGVGLSWCAGSIFFGPNKNIYIINKG